ncbi:MAG: amidohydrolase [Cellulomonadaceae bacterium]|jgi:amidohydrolase|nr:amidohydrolase [Cellulomonadaceae bacterium]
MEDETTADLGHPSTLKELDLHIAQAAADINNVLITFRRDLHQHPEIAHGEFRTTAKIFERLTSIGLSPVRLDGTGLVCDLGPSRDAEGKTVPRVGLRADLDALPIPDSCGEEWESETPGLAHACGHDVHATVLLGAAYVLQRLDAQGLLTLPVRLIFQPAEEIMPGGAHNIIEAKALEGLDSVVALHCEPKLDVGQIATRIGPITSAADSLSVTVSSKGGHTSRPHLTGDVIYALGEIITQVPGVLGRRLDPRWGVNLTWGLVRAGDSHNAIPSSGTVSGTLRCLDSQAWEKAANILDEAIEQVAAPYAVDVTFSHVRGVPPVDNDPDITTRMEEAARAVVGRKNLIHAPQSLGGEDFGWYLTKVRGTLARLGTRTPGGKSFDLHQGDLVIDERAIEIGVRLLAGVAIRSQAGQ